MPREFDASRPELMDIEQPVSSALVQDLANLRLLNRWFGSHRLVLRFLRRWLTPAQPWRVLDLATGSGDIPQEIISFARREGIMATVDAVDFQASTIEIARSLCQGFPEIRFHIADIRTFGGGQKWDVVLCSLALHHFSDDQAVSILRRCRDLSERFVLVADLRRNLLGSAGVYLLTATILREPMTQHDARTSMRRAFSFDEFHALAVKAAWTNFGHARFFCSRQALWLG